MVTYGVVNAAARARRGRDVRLGIQASSRRCLEPPGWVLSSPLFRLWGRRNLNRLGRRGVAQGNDTRE